MDFKIKNNTRPHIASSKAVKILSESKLGSVKRNQIPWKSGVTGPYWVKTSLFGIFPSDTPIAAASITPSW